MLKTLDEIKDYLDRNILFWRDAKKRSIEKKPDRNGRIFDTNLCSNYIDAYQSVRISIFGKILK